MARRPTTRRRLPAARRNNSLRDSLEAPRRSVQPSGERVYLFVRTQQWWHALTIRVSGTIGFPKLLEPPTYPLARKLPSPPLGERPRARMAGCALCFKDVDTGAARPGGSAHRPDLVDEDAIGVDPTANFPWPSVTRPHPLCRRRSNHRKDHGGPSMHNPLPRVCRYGERCPCGQRHDAPPRDRASTALFGGEGCEGGRDMRTKPPWSGNNYAARKRRGHRAHGREPRAMLRRFRNERLRDSECDDGRGMNDEDRQRRRRLDSQLDRLDLQPITRIEAEGRDDRPARDCRRASGRAQGGKPLGWDLACGLACEGNARERRNARTPSGPDWPRTRLGSSSQPWQRQPSNRRVDDCERQDPRQDKA